VRGYLLDTNIVAYWEDSGRPQHLAVKSRVESLPANASLLISAISLGEISYGHATAGSKDAAKQRGFLEFIRTKLPVPLDVRPSTAAPYGDLRAALFERYAPGRDRAGLRPEQLVDPITALSLQIQENDIWIAAQSIEYNLILVSGDGGMRRLVEAAPGLITLENWTDPTKTLP
jgi:tRNA(fMet)-specific endonuclease VapC